MSKAVKIIADKKHTTCLVFEAIDLSWPSNLYSWAYVFLYFLCLLYNEKE